MATYEMELSFVNADGETLSLHPQDHIHITNFIGPWSAPSFRHILARNADGDDNRADQIQVDDAKLLTLDCVIESDGLSEIHDIISEMGRIMRPWQSYRVVNRGYFYLARLNNIDAPDEHRKPVLPIMPEPPFQPTGANPHHRMPIQFAPLSAYWESAEETTITLRAASAATWTTFTTSVDPGGTAHTWPTWEIDGHATTITGIKIENDTTGYELEVTPISIGSGQMLTVTTTPHGLVVARSDGTNYKSKLSTVSHFFPLIAAPQDLIFTKTGGTSQSAVRVKYRTRRQGL